VTANEFIELINSFLNYFPFVWHWLSIYALPSSFKRLC